MSETDRTPLQPPHTRGTEAERAAHRLVQRRRVAYGWLRALRPLVERMERTAPSGKRFERVPPTALRATRARPASPGEDEVDAPGEPLAGDVQERLRGVLGRSAGVLRVHDDGNADRIARAQDADAVTIDRDVFFRNGRFQPREPEGFALLAHENLHALEASSSGAPERRSTSAGVRREEQRAENLEQRVIERWHQPLVQPAMRLIAPRIPVPAGRDAARPMGAGAPEARANTASLARPMAAASDRDDAPSEASSASAGPDLEAIRRTIYRDLVTQIRAEFERGG